MAIARDATTVISGTVNPSLSTNVTVTGSNPILIFGFILGADVISSVTYNGVAMTQLTKLAGNGGAFLYLYFLIGPTTGTHALIVNTSVADAVDGAATSYTGYLPLTFPNASTTNSGATPLTTSLTTTIDNCWTFLIADSCNVPLNSGGAGANQLSANHGQGCGTFDSNGAISPAGSTSMQTVNGSGTFHHIMVAFAPVAPVSTPILIATQRQTAAQTRSFIRAKALVAVQAQAAQLAALKTKLKTLLATQPQVAKLARQCGRLSFAIQAQLASLFKDDAFVYITINGVAYGQNRADPTQRVLYDTLTIREADGQHTQCTFTTDGFAPTIGNDVIVQLEDRRIFGGVILDVNQVSVGASSNAQYAVQAIGYSWLADRRKVLKVYTEQSATAIAQDLIASFVSGFTANNVAPLLTAITAISFVFTSVTDALQQIATWIGGTKVIDYFKDLHLFVTDADPNPADLTPTHPTLFDFTSETILTQVVTRLYGLASGPTAAAAAVVGATSLDVTDASPFNAGGGTIVTGAQRITYSGVSTGGSTVQGGSALTGYPAPTNVPGLYTAAGGVPDEFGAWKVAVSFLYSDGTETQIGPISAGVNVPSNGFALKWDNVDIGPSGVTKRFGYLKKPSSSVFLSVAICHSERQHDDDDLHRRADRGLDAAAADDRRRGWRDLDQSHRYVRVSCRRRLDLGRWSGLTYTGRSVASGPGSLTGIPAVGCGSIGSAINLGTAIGVIIPAGSTSLPVADTTNFSAGGGTARTGSQTFMYTGKSAASGAGNLTGIPASGAGALTAAVTGGATVLVGAGGAGLLTGIPASGPGSISMQSIKATASISSSRWMTSPRRRRSLRC